VTAPQGKDRRPNKTWASKFRLTYVRAQLIKLLGWLRASWIATTFPREKRARRALVVGLLWALLASGSIVPLPPAPVTEGPGAEATPTVTATPAQTVLAEGTGTPTAVQDVYQQWLPMVVQDPSPTPTATPTVTHTPEPTATPTPAPTPALTPTPVPWPEPLEVPGYSRLGLHVQWNNSPEIMEFIRRMKPAVVKALDDLGFLQEVKQASPATIIVARLSVPQPTDGDPEAQARAFVANNLPTYLEHPAVDYWEGYNEPDVQGKMDWYARFEAARVRAMAEHGLKCAIGSFSTGVPELEAFQHFLPAIQAARAHGGVLSLHEYDAPIMDRSIGTSLPGLPGRPDRGTLTLRYRWWYEDILIPQGLEIPLVITEAGVDGLVGNRPGPADGRGWQDFAEYWSEQYPGHSALEVYVEQLAWYDHEVQKDPYVLGWALFTAGPLGPQWQSYDVTDQLRYIAWEILVPQAR
jgi:hypothetical protein